MLGNDVSAAWRKDRDHFIHPYTDFTTFAREGSHVVTRARGVHIVDESGREYLDGIAGLWCANLGHGREEIADAMSEQARRMQYYNTFGHSTNVPAVRESARSIKVDSIEVKIRGDGVTHGRSNRGRSMSIVR